MSRNWIIAALTVYAPIAAAATPIRPPEAQTDSGRVRGASHGAVRSFLGLPFAATTGGANRWREPQPVRSWRGIRDASRFGADCQQDPPPFKTGETPYTPEYLPSGPMSEDCLFLNIWSPTRSERLPVLVWIHGGGFAGGSGAVPIYQGDQLARRGIVVVTINYRVGVFGFVAHPQLSSEQGSSGNYGLLDQIAALQWVQRNIRAFGGDPDRVTIAGQSAGAASVHALMSSPAARGLFDRAIAQSGTGMGLPAVPRAEAEALGSRVAAAAGADSIDALRALPVDAVLRAARDPAIGRPGLRYVPIAEPRVLPEPARVVNRVPLLTGLNADETSGGGDWNTSDRPALDALLRRRFGNQWEIFSRLYQGNEPSPIQAAARAMLRDRGIASMFDWASQNAGADLPIYAYLFDRTPPGPQPDRWGAFHTAETPYVFGTLAAGDRAFAPEDRAVSATMMRYWTNFVRTGNPNGRGLPRWPRYVDGAVMEMGDRFGIIRPLSPEMQRAYRIYIAQGGTLSIF